MLISLILRRRVSAISKDEVSAQAAAHKPYAIALRHSGPCPSRNFRFFPALNATRTSGRRTR